MHATATTYVDCFITSNTSCRAHCMPDGRLARAFGLQAVMCTMCNQSVMRSLALHMECSQPSSGMCWSGYFRSQTSRSCVGSVTYLLWRLFTYTGQQVRPLCSIIIAWLQRPRGELPTGVARSLMRLATTMESAVVLTLLTDPQVKLMMQEQ